MIEQICIRLQFASNPTLQDVYFYFEHHLMRSISALFLSQVL